MGYGHAHQISQGFNFISHFYLQLSQILSPCNVADLAVSPREAHRHPTLMWCRLRLQFSSAEPTQLNSVWVFQSCLLSQRLASCKHHPV